MELVPFVVDEDDRPSTYRTQHRFAHRRGRHQVVLVGAGSRGRINSTKAHQTEPPPRLTMIRPFLSHSTEVIGRTTPKRSIVTISMSPPKNFCERASL